MAGPRGPGGAFGGWGATGGHTGLPARRAPGAPGGAVGRGPPRGPAGDPARGADVPAAAAVAAAHGARLARVHRRHRRRQPHLVALRRDVRALDDRHGRRRRDAGRRAAPGGGRRGPQGLPALPRPDAPAGPRDGGRPAARPRVDPPRARDARGARAWPADVGAPPDRPGLRARARRPRLAAPRHRARPAADRAGRGPRADVRRWRCAASCAPTRSCPDLPTAVSLRAFASVGVTGGDAASRRGLVRALLAQLVHVPRPDDLRDRGGRDGRRHAPSGTGSKWLPHVAAPAAVRRRRAGADGDVLAGRGRGVAAPELAGTGRGSPGAPRRPPTPATWWSCSTAPRSPRDRADHARGRDWSASP